MMSRSKLRWLALSSTCLVPLVAQAQETFELDTTPPTEKVAPVYNNFIEAGAAYTTADAFRRGRFTGMQEQDVYAVSNFGLLYRDPWNGDSTRFFRSDGTNLGLDSRSVTVEGGWQGFIKGFFFYDEIPAFEFEGTTPYSGIGTRSLQLPNTWVTNAAAGNATAASTVVATNPTAFHPVEIKQERTRRGGGLTWNATPDWQVSGRFQSEEKEGLKVLGFAWGSTGGNPLSILVPETVDYRTDKLDMGVGYTGRGAQLQINYQMSQFENQVEAFRVQNPFSNTAANWSNSANANYPGFGTMQLPPDNRAHQLNLSGGVDLGESTRLTANFAYGVHLQDEAFQGYAGIPAGVLVPVPRSSLNGKIITTLGNVELTSRPLDNVDVKLKYRFTDRENETPRDLYQYTDGEVVVQGALATSSSRINHPYSFREHLASVDGGYRVTPRTKLTAGYDFRQVERSFQEQEISNEHTARVQSRTTITDQVSGKLKYAHSWRYGTNYIPNHPFLDGFSGSYLATLGRRQWDSHTELRKFYMADRQKDTVSAGVNYMPVEAWNLGLTGSATNEWYPNSELGVENVLVWSTTADVSFAPNPAVTTYGFYTYDIRNAKQNNHSWSGTATQPYDLNRRWSGELGNTSHTAGVGGRVKATERWSFGADYVLVYAVADFAFSAAPTLNAIGLPENPTRIHALGLNTSYEIVDGFSVGLAYGFENYSSSDWANVGLGDVSRVVGFGQDNFNYTVHVIAVGAKMQF